MIIKNEPDEIQSYLTDAANFKGTADAVYIPESISELKLLMKESFEKNVPITFSGGGTSVTAARVPDEGIMISMEKLNKIYNIDVERRLIRLEPGVSLLSVEEALNGTGLFYPPNPTEKNCTIGGNISTNASGSRTFKYGSTRKYVHSIKLILSGGEEMLLERGKNIAVNGTLILESVSGYDYRLPLPSFKMPEVKSVSGYYIYPAMDAVDLFIGSEGTLAAVTEATIALLPAPEKVLGLIVFFDEINNLLEFVEVVREEAIKSFTSGQKELISPRLIEFFDSNSLKLLSEKYPQIETGTEGAIWLEQEYSESNENETLEEWMRLINKYTKFGDSTWSALNDNEHEKLRKFRHELPLRVNEIISRNGVRKIGTDLAVPNSYMKSFYGFLKKELSILGLEYVIFSHIGNSHFHANVLPKNNDEWLAGMEFYEKCIIESIRLGGSIAGEHGIGKIKSRYLRSLYGDEAVDGMIGIKTILDPKNLLCRGNLFCK